MELHMIRPVREYLSPVKTGQNYLRSGLLNNLRPIDNINA
jgi:hypothetical protein